MVVTPNNLILAIGKNAQKYFLAYQGFNRKQYIAMLTLMIANSRHQNQYLFIIQDE